MYENIMEENFVLYDSRSSWQMRFFLKMVINSLYYNIYYTSSYHDINSTVQWITQMAWTPECGCL